MNDRLSGDERNALEQATEYGTELAQHPVTGRYEIRGGCSKAAGDRLVSRGFFRLQGHDAAGYRRYAITETGRYALSVARTTEVTS